MVIAKKTTTTKKTALKAVPGAGIKAKAETEVATKIIDPNIVKKKEIYEYVSVSTGLRKRDVREAVDSLLEYFHKCLEDGKTIQAPPLGKIRTIQRGTGENVKQHYKLILKKPPEAEKKAD